MGQEMRDFQRMEAPSTRLQAHGQQTWGPSPTGAPGRAVPSCSAWGLRELTMGSAAR